MDTYIKHTTLRHRNMTAELERKTEKLSIEFVVG